MRWLVGLCVRHAGTIATLTLIVATLDAHHWMGSFAPDIDVLCRGVEKGLADLLVAS